MSNKQEKEAPADLFETRLEKLDELVKNGQNPYAISFRRTHKIGPLLEVPEAEYEKAEQFTIGGRVRSKRMMGKAAFMDLEDDTGRLQLYGAQKILGDDFELFKTLDLGDILGVVGELFLTKTGQISLRIQSFKLVSKCLRPLPVVKEADGKVFDAFSDKEQRYRMRYVDLVVNPDVRKTFETRSKIIANIRQILISKGFLEVETPMMQSIPGGAAARPFETHHNALDMGLYLRIAPELYLKRLLVGGFAKVFELNRNFRNEGISFKHNPEFTMLELYEAFGDMGTMLELCEELIVSSVELVHGKGNTTIQYGEHSVDMSSPWRQVKWADAIEEHSGVKFDEHMSLEDAKKAAAGVGISKDKLDECSTVWKVAEEVFDERVEPKLIQPVFLTHFPKELSPLAKTWQENENYVERFEPYVVGRELGNAFSELNDPIDQKARFEEQVADREAGNDEGGFMDNDYVRALEYGMPPAGGLGIGIDRLVMLITNAPSIRDVILFPQLRKE